MRAGGLLVANGGAAGGEGRLRDELGGREAGVEGLDGGRAGGEEGLRRLPRSRRLFSTSMSSSRRGSFPTKAAPARTAWRRQGGGDRRGGRRRRPSGEGGRVRVLTIDGCGPGPGDALLEAALRARAGDPDVRVADFFDAAAGAGAGGVLAAMLFLKGEDGRARYSAADALAFVAASLGKGGGWGGRRSRWAALFRRAEKPSSGRRSRWAALFWETAGDGVPSIACGSLRKSLFPSAEGGASGDSLRLSPVVPGSRPARGETGRKRYCSISSGSRIEARKIRGGVRPAVPSVFSLLSGSTDGALLATRGRVGGGSRPRRRWSGGRGLLRVARLRRGIEVVVVHARAWVPPRRRPRRAARLGEAAALWRDRGREEQQREERRLVADEDADVLPGGMEGGGGEAATAAAASMAPELALAVGSRAGSTDGTPTASASGSSFRTSASSGPCTRRTLRPTTPPPRHTRRARPAAARACCRCAARVVLRCACGDFFGRVLEKLLETGCFYEAGSTTFSFIFRMRRGSPGDSLTKLIGAVKLLDLLTASSSMCLVSA